MGFLLMQYEYQRASREVTVHERAGIRLNNMVERYTKRVKNMESIFQKAQDRMENNFNTLNNQANSTIQLAASAQDPNQFLRALGGIVIGGISLAQYGQYSFSGTTDKNQLMNELSVAASQARANLTVLINAVKENEMSKIEMQKDEQLQPISEKESDLQAEQALEETLCDTWRQRKENAKSRLGEDIQNGISKYGLK